MANSCETCKHYEVEAYNEPCNSCRIRDHDVPTKWESPFKQQKTNADRIRAMSDEELAVWVTLIRLDTINEMCKEFDVEIEIPIPTAENTADICEWLKQPAEEEDNDS